MVVRKRKKSVTKLGKRTRHGNTKNWQGSGSRGGKGHAGSQKHKQHNYFDKFGTKKRQPKTSKHLKAINIGDLDRLLPVWKAQQRVAQNKAGQFVVDGRKVGVQKLLGGGQTSNEFVFENILLTQKAREKIEGTEFESEAGETA